MDLRETLTPVTVVAVASQNSGHPVEPADAATYAEAFEGILQGFAALRALPIKEIEPACVFVPFGAGEP